MQFESEYKIEEHIDGGYRTFKLLDLYARFCNDLDIGDLTTLFLEAYSNTYSTKNFDIIKKVFSLLVRNGHECNVVKLEHRVEPKLMYLGVDKFYLTKNGRK